MFREIQYLLCLTLLLCCCSCKNSEEKLAFEKKESADKVAAAEANVDKARKEARGQIMDAQGSEAVDDAKVEATKDIAEAKHELGDAKVEATRNVTEAETEAQSEAEKEEHPMIP